MRSHSVVSSASPYASTEERFGANVIACPFVLTGTCVIARDAGCAWLPSGYPLDMVEATAYHLYCARLESNVHLSSDDTLAKLQPLVTRVE